MSTTSNETTVQVILDAGLVERLRRIAVPPFVGKSNADRVEYAVHLFVEQFRGAPMVRKTHEAKTR